MRKFYLGVSASGAKVLDLQNYVDEAAGSMPVLLDRMPPKTA